MKFLFSLFRAHVKNEASQKEESRHLFSQVLHVCMARNAFWARVLEVRSVYPVLEGILSVFAWVADATAGRRDGFYADHKNPFSPREEQGVLSVR